MLFSKATLIVYRGIYFCCTGDIPWNQKLFEMKHLSKAFLMMVIMGLISCTPTKTLVDTSCPGYRSSDFSRNQISVGKNGILGDHGRSRWKQSVFYDYLKDASTLITGISVLRFSKWEQDENEYFLNDLICNEQKAAVILQFEKMIMRTDM